jgi:protocatechuate 3,4-dioxygenase beta subunit
MVRKPMKSTTDQGQIPFLAVLIGLLVVAIAMVFVLDPGTPNSNDQNLVSEEDDPVQETLESADHTPEPDVTQNLVGERTATQDSDAEIQSDGPRGAAIRGSVINQQNDPVPGATVVLTEQAAFSSLFAGGRDQRAMRTFQTRTATDGTFSFTKLPVDVQFGMWVHHSTYAPSQGVSVRALANEAQDLAPVVLGSGYRIFGQVTDDAGNPLQGAEVMVQLHASQNFGFRDADLMALEEETGRLRRAVSDGNGKYEMLHLSQGIYQIESQLEDFAAAIDNAVQCMGEDFDVERNLTLGTEHRLVGLVRDEAGNPIADALVAAARIRPRPIYSVETRTDENGNFELRGLPEGAYGLNTMPEGYAPARLTHVQSNRTDIELVVRQKGSVRGSVSGTHGEPITSFTLELFRLNKGTAQYGVTNRRMQFNDPAGEFHFTNLDRGSYVLLVRAPGLSPTYTGGFFIEREEHSGVNVQLIEGGTIEGVVTDPNGNPLAAAEVTLRGQDYLEWNANSIMADSIGDPNNVPVMTVKTNSQGRFRMENAYPGDHQIECKHSSYLTTYAGISVLADRNNDIGEVRLEQGGTIQGTVTSKSGSPAAGATVYLSLKDTNGGFFSRKALADAMGRFSYDGLQPGQYDLSAVQDDSTIFLFPGADPGSSAEVYLKLGRLESVKLTVPDAQ